MTKTRCKEQGLDKFFNFHLLGRFKCQKCGVVVPQKKFVCEPFKIEKEKLSLKK